VTTPRPPRSSVRPANRDHERGYVLVILALMSIVLLAFAGYSVDLGNWNVQKNKANTAAEAAALGGVAFLPDDFPRADAIARQIARNHGFTDVEVELGSAPNQLEVTVNTVVENYFVRVLGNKTKSFAETSVAEFAQPVEMGSPTTILGNDPESGHSPNYWLSIASRKVPKDFGDRFATEKCTNKNGGGCKGSKNAEYDSSGYKYSIRVTDTNTPLRVQVFDPAWTWTGSTCNIPDWPTPAEIAQLQADALLPAFASQVPPGYYLDAARRYEGGETAWCTGDDRPGSSGPQTRFTVRLPDQTPWDDNDNPRVRTGGCDRITFPAYSPTSPYALPTSSIYELLSPSAGPNDDQWKIDANDNEITFAESFRRWVTVCEIKPGPWLQEGDYIIQVSTRDKTAGQNRFSLRAGPPSGPNGILDVGQSLYSRGRLPIFTNTSASDVKFFVARVPPSARDRLLRISFFDIGDAASPGSLTIEPGPDSNMVGTGFTNCVFTRSDIGDITPPGGGCTLTGVWDSNGFGEQTVEGEITIPKEYTCKTADPDACWVSVRVKFPGGITDATTWTAELVGDAIRVVSS
jgi:Putative Flp pilus-assembly TadE/G-like